MSAVSGHDPARPSAEAVQKPAGQRLPGPIALAAIVIAAFLLAVAGTLWIVAGEAVFQAMVEAGAQVLCL